MLFYLTLSQEDDIKVNLKSALFHPVDLWTEILYNEKSNVQMDRKKVTVISICRMKSYV
jgi:hypothetical protein